MNFLNSDCVGNPLDLLESAGFVEKLVWICERIVGFVGEIFLDLAMDMQFVGDKSRFSFFFGLQLIFVYLVQLVQLEYFLGQVTAPLSFHHL